MYLVKLFKDIRFKEVIDRFGMALFFSVITSVCLIILIANTFTVSNEEISNSFFVTQEDYIRLAMVGTLAFLTAINWRLFCESRLVNKIGHYIALVVALVLLDFYYFYLRQVDIWEEVIGFRFIGMVLFLHLTISYLPFLRSDGLDSFWEYNKRLFANFFTSAFFTLVIYLGISLALLALEYLFGMSNNNGKLYGQLFVILAGIFHPIYFLSEFPKKIEQLETVILKKSFKIFVIYILIPISILYLTILYAYGIKIGVEASLPQGWVSKLVLSFCIIGILTYLLNYTFPKQIDSKLSSGFKKLFFPFLLIPIGLLLMAIYVRISEYGITEFRYIIALLTAWLVFVSIYIIISKKDNIKILPITLSAMVLFSLFGPLNMFKISLNNQFKTLKKGLEENGLLVNNLLVNQDTLDQKTQNILAGKIKYLYDHEKLNLLSSFSSDEVNLDFLSTEDGILKYSHLSKTYQAIGLNPKNHRNYQNRYFSFNAIINKPIDVSSYEKFGFFDKGNAYGNEYDFRQIDETTQFRLMTPFHDDMIIDMETMINTLVEKNQSRRSLKEMSLTAELDSSSVNIIFVRLSILREVDEFKINHYSGYLLIE